MCKKLKILVCDRNQVFLRYFEKRFSHCNFIFFSNVKDEFFSLDEFDRVIFIQEGPMEEYKTFFMLFDKSIPIIFGIYKRIPISAKYKIKETSNVRMLYMLETKQKISDQLREYL